jgi:hypothetical protein
MTYEDTVGDLMGHYGDHQLAAACQVQLKDRIQLIIESLQEFAAAIEHLAHRALVGLPMDFIQMEVVHAFIDSERPISEAAPPHGQQQVT